MAISTYKISGVTVSKSSTESSWRLVHDGDKVLSLFESVGATETRFTLFTGTEDACLAEIDRLDLTPLPQEEE